MRTASLAKKNFPASATAVFAGLCCALFVKFWFLPLGASLDLDETGTFWMIRDGVGQTLAHLQQWPAQMPLYSVLEATWAGLFGTSETLLRLPSVLYLLVAAEIIFRLGRRLYDTTAGWWSVAVFMFAGAWAATDARPYALALCATAFSWYALIRFLEEPEGRWRWLYGCAAAAVFYAHTLYALTLVPQGLWLAYQIFRQPRLALPAADAGLTALGLALPQLPALQHLTKASGAFSFPGRLSVSVLADFSVALLLLLVPWPYSQPAVTHAPLSRAQTHWLLAIGVGLPIGLLWLGARYLGLDLFRQRYLMVCLVPLAILSGQKIARVGSRTLQNVLAGAALVASILPVFPALAQGSPAAAALPQHEDWRRAAAALGTEAAGPSTALLVRSGFDESVQGPWPATENNFFFAPFDYYPVAVPRFPLPEKLDYRMLAYLRRQAPQLRRYARLDFVTNESIDQEYQATLTQFLVRLGFRPDGQTAYGLITVVSYSSHS